MKHESKQAGLAWLTFLTSSSTLICCTLPILFVALGFGATLASLTTLLPWWITLSKHKFWLFFSSGLLILISYWSFKKQGQSCPTDPMLAEKCKRLHRWNLRILRFSLLIWIIGFISAYLAVPISNWLGIL